MMEETLHVVAYFFRNKIIWKTSDNRSGSDGAICFKNLRKHFNKILNIEDYTLEII